MERRSCRPLTAALLRSNALGAQRPPKKLHKAVVKQGEAGLSGKGTGVAEGRGRMFGPCSPARLAGRSQLVLLPSTLAAPPPAQCCLARYVLFDVCERWHVHVGDPAAISCSPAATHSCAGSLWVYFSNASARISGVDKPFLPLSLPRRCTSWLPAPVLGATGQLSCGFEEYEEEGHAICNPHLGAACRQAEPSRPAAGPAALSPIFYSRRLPCQYHPRVGLQMH